MNQTIQQILFYSRLTLPQLKGIVSSRQVDTPVVPRRGALPSRPLNGIITLTLVVSKRYDLVCEGPAVKRGAFVMWNIFRIKTKLQTQLEEYVKYKGESSPHIGGDHKEILSAFIKHVSHKTVSEITPEEIEAYHKKIRGEMTPYTTIKAMQAIRAFMRFHKHDTNIIARDISNTGMTDLQNVGRQVPRPIIRPKRGRPVNQMLVDQIRRLRDKEQLSFRAISKALKKDLKNVYLLYKYGTTYPNVGRKSYPQKKD